MYLVRLERHLDVPQTQKRLIVSEVRAHVLEKVAALRRAEPNARARDLTRRVLDDFGDPDRLALAYADDGEAVLRDAEGATVLRFSAAVTRASQVVGAGAAAVGRGAGRTLKVVAISLLVFLVVATLSGTLGAIFLFHDIEATVRAHQEYDVYDARDTSCRASVCDQAVGPASFYIHPDANAVRLYVEARSTASEGDTATNGTLTVVVLDPNGEPAYQRAFSGTGFFVDRIALVPTPGAWQVTVTYAGFQGWHAVQVETIGLP